MSGPLAGLKVLDFSALLPGPFATMMLADLGADVLRLEAPSRPDMVRMVPPMASDGNSAAHGYLNRSKRSLAVDLKTADGIAIVHALIAEYDIVVEQFRPGVMDRLGVGYEALRAINPRIIYCSITGYGQDGPYKNRAGHDMNYLAIAGVLGYNGRKQSGPAPIAVQVADIAGGSYHGVIGVLAAVIHRSNTGIGQHIDISMTDAAFSMNALTAPGALMGGDQPSLETTQLNGGTFYDCYATADGRYFSVGGLEPQFFMQFCAAIGRPDVAPMGLNMQPHVVAELKAIIREEMLKKTYAQWEQVFAALDSCTEPVLTFAEAAEHPHIKARGLIVNVLQHDGKTQRQLASPIKFSETPASYQYSGASLGQHTHEVMSALGYSDADIAALRKANTIV